jgi:hypothetical protein
VNDIIGGAKNAFSFTILRRCIGTGHAKKHAVGLEEGASVEVVKLAVVVALDALNGGSKLCVNVSEKGR